MDVRGWFDRRIDPTQLTAGVAVGDLVAITAFVVAGQYQHGSDPLANPGSVLETAAPFFVAWIFVALLGGLYTRDAFVTVRRAASWSTPAWIFAVLIALLVRATPLVPGNASLVFTAVAIVIGGALVIGFRTVVTALHTRTRG